MTVIQGVSCEVCNKQRAPGDIHARESRLLKNMKLFVCSQCEVNKKEPRGFIILAAKRYGTKAVKDYLDNHRYEGEVILGKEIA